MDGLVLLAVCAGIPLAYGVVKAYVGQVQIEEEGARWRNDHRKNGLPETLAEECNNSINEKLNNQSERASALFDNGKSIPTWVNPHFDSEAVATHLTEIGLGESITTGIREYARERGNDTLRAAEVGQLTTELAHSMSGATDLDLRILEIFGLPAERVTVNNMILNINILFIALPMFFNLEDEDGAKAEQEIKTAVYESLAPQLVEFLPALSTAFRVEFFKHLEGQQSKLLDLYVGQPADQGVRGSPIYLTYEMGLLTKMNNYLFAFQYWLHLLRKEGLLDAEHL